MSYRPVALTSHLSKVLEHLIRGPLVDHLESQGHLDSAQHGARAGCSTLSQLLIQHDAILQMLEDGGNCDVIYLDFSKAFDKVDHGLLLLKLRRMGVVASLGRWIGNFLLEHLQAVRVGAGTSTWAKVLSGIPQGSVLGPLLFLVFISDLGGSLGPEDALVLKYIDDTKLLKKVESMGDVEALQGNLDTLYQWQADNNMAWNGSKFQALRLGGKPHLREDSLLFTPGHEDPIMEVEVTKDLSILLDSSLSFRDQRASAVAKAKQKAGWVLRMFRTREPYALRTLWKALIQPHLDYASQLWAPVSNKGALEEQESPLRAFTKRFKGLSQLPYWERLERTGILSSERRQERYRCIYTWKILNGLVPNCGVQLESSMDSRRGKTATIPPLLGPGPTSGP